MSKELNYDINIGYNENQYFLMNDGSILEVGHEPDPSSPFGSVCAGDYGYGTYASEAYKDAWDKMDRETTDAIKDKVATYLMDHMQVEEGVVQEQFGVMNVTVDERDVPVATFPGVKGMEKMVLDLEENFDDIVNDKDTELLLELVQRDYYDPFCGGDGMFSPKEMLEFCKDNEIDLSDIVLIKEVPLDRSSTTVIFIEAQELKDFDGTKLKNATQEEKADLLDTAIEFAEMWNNGDVYQWGLYDKDGDFIEGCGGFYGDDAISDYVENFSGVTDKDIDAVKDLGKHDDIADCLYANRKELVKSGEER